MTITHCIKELVHLLIKDGNLKVEGVSIRQDKLQVQINGNWYKFNEYIKYGGKYENCR